MNQVGGEFGDGAAANGGGKTWRRRTVLKALAAVGVGSDPFRRALAAEADEAGRGKVTAEMIKQAEWIAGLDLTDKEREETAGALQRSLESFAALRRVDVGYDVPPALSFVPAPGLRP